MKYNAGYNDYFAGVKVMKRFCITVWALVVLFAGVDLLSALPPIEGSTNQQPILFMKRKNFTTTKTTAQDTLYCGSTTADTTMVYIPAEYTGIQVIGFSASAGTVDVNVRILNGYASSTKFYLAPVDSTEATKIGASAPKTVDMQAGGFFAVEAKGQGANAADVRVQVILTRYGTSRR